MAECRQRNYGLALSLIEKYRIQPTSIIGYGDGSTPSLNIFCRNYGLILINELRGMEISILAQLAVQGLSVHESSLFKETSIADAEMAMTCVYDVGAHNGASGKDQLIHLAAMALVGQVFDILSRRLEAIRLRDSTREIELQIH